MHPPPCVKTDKDCLVHISHIACRAGLDASVVPEYVKLVQLPWMNEAGEKPRHVVVVFHKLRDKLVVEKFLKTGSSSMTLIDTMACDVCARGRKLDSRTK